jgi:hypothetical protein
MHMNKNGVVYDSTYDVKLKCSEKSATDLSNIVSGILPLMKVMPEYIFSTTTLHQLPISDPNPIHHNSSKELELRVI